MFKINQFRRQSKSTLLLIFNTTAITKSRFTGEMNTFKFDTMFAKIQSMTQILVLTINHFMKFFINNRANINRL